jgi:hypothetical protein
MLSRGVMPPESINNGSSTMIISRANCGIVRAEGVALADDVPEVVLGADLLLQVDLFLGSLSLRAAISWKARAFSAATATWLANCCRKSTSAAS